MDKHLNIVLGNNADFESELIKNFENAVDSTNQITYYFEDRETNPLKNVLTSAINSCEITHYHKHDFYEINYVMSGILHEIISGKCFTLTAGSMLIMAPGVFHSCVPEENSMCYNILFKKDYFQRISKDFKSYDPNNYLTHLDENTIYTIINAGEYEDEIRNTAKNVLKLSHSIVHHSDLYENLSFENTAAELLLLLTKIPRHEYNFESGKQQQRENFTPDDIVRYINDNFDKIDLSDTALRFGYSKCQLHRIIKQHTSYTFSEIIRNIRMQRARHYLLNTHLPIKNIAYLLGLDSAEHFSRMFTKNRGMTPKEYREAYMRASLKKSKKRTKK